MRIRPGCESRAFTSRSYENHYPTMTWSEICALPVKDIVLPDAWLFLWIPRAHAFALHEIETEVTLLDGTVTRARVKMPLAWAVAHSWGFDAYSTAFVWTKTGEDHPDEAGGAVLVRDQNELLLMFKRGRGLPKPDNGEKFGSNHRERSRPLGHSTKPQHFAA
jgi:N6-adenosine-specific RNA methylase IME4